MILRTISCVIGGIVFLCLGGCTAAGPWQTDLALEETFSRALGTRWWIEGGEKVWIEDGKLFMKADPLKGGPGSTCTAWYRRRIAGDFEIEYDAHVISSGLGVNNVNFFFCYSDPSGKSLFETRESRDDADYAKYHDLNGYIVTFLKDTKREGGEHKDGTTKARFRMRRCPGFELIAETFAGHCEAEQTYHCKIVRKRGVIEFHVNGTKYLQAEDTEPHVGGLIGLRTFGTTLWWDNIRVRALRD